MPIPAPANPAGWTDGLDEDADEASSLDASPRKADSAGGFLATQSSSGRGMCRGAAYARRVSSLRREDDGGSPAVLMQETSLLEALGPRVRAARSTCQLSALSGCLLACRFCSFSKSLILVSFFHLHPVPPRICMRHAESGMPSRHAGGDAT